MLDKSERKQLVTLIFEMRQKGIFRGRFTEISWTEQGVRINGESYNTVRALRKRFAPF